MAQDTQMRSDFTKTTSGVDGRSMDPWPDGETGAAGPTPRWHTCRRIATGFVYWVFPAILVVVGGRALGRCVGRDDARATGKTQRPTRRRPPAPPPPAGPEWRTASKKARQHKNVFIFTSCDARPRALSSCVVATAILVLLVILIGGR